MITTLCQTHTERNIKSIFVLLFEIIGFVFYQIGRLTPRQHTRMTQQRSSKMLKHKREKVRAQKTLVSNIEKHRRCCRDRENDCESILPAMSDKRPPAKNSWTDINTIKSRVPIVQMQCDCADSGKSRCSIISGRSEWTIGEPRFLIKLSINSKWIEVKWNEI